MSSQDDLIKTGILAAVAVAALLFWSIKGIKIETEFHKDGTKKKERMTIRGRKPAETAEALKELWPIVAKSLGVPLSAILGVVQLDPPLKRD